MGVRMRIPVSFLGRARLHTTCGNQQLGLRMCGLVCKSIPIRDFHFIQSWRKKLGSSYRCLMCKCIHTGQCEDVNAPPFDHIPSVSHMYIIQLPRVRESILCSLGWRQWWRHARAGWYPLQWKVMPPTSSAGKGGYGLWFFVLCLHCILTWYREGWTGTLKKDPSHRAPSILLACVYIHMPAIVWPTDWFHRCVLSTILGAPWGTAQGSRALSRYRLRRPTHEVLFYDIHKVHVYCHQSASKIIYIYFPEVLIACVSGLTWDSRILYFLMWCFTFITWWPIERNTAYMGKWSILILDLI